MINAYVKKATFVTGTPLLKGHRYRMRPDHFRELEALGKVELYDPAVHGPPKDVRDGGQVAVKPGPDGGEPLEGRGRSRS